MQIVLAFLIGGLFAIAIYLMLRRTVARVIIGLALLTNATNLLIFTVGGLTRAAPPLIPDGQYRPTGPIADPMPVAIVLNSAIARMVASLMLRNNEHKSAYFKNETEALAWLDEV